MGTCTASQCPQDRHLPAQLGGLDPITPLIPAMPLSCRQRSRRQEQGQNSNRIARDEVNRALTVREVSCTYVPRRRRRRWRGRRRGWKRGGGPVGAGEDGPFDDGRNGSLEAKRLAAAEGGAAGVVMMGAKGKSWRPRLMVSWWRCACGRFIRACRIDSQGKRTGR